MATRKRRAVSTKKKEPVEKENLQEPQTSRKALLDALGFVKPGIASGSIIEQSDLVLMDDDRIISYNDEIAVSHPYEIGHTGGVYANELYKLLQKLPADEIEIGEAEEDGQNQLVIRCENGEYDFFIVPDVTVPELGIDDIAEAWVELPSDFCQGISLCLSSAATDVAKGILTCVHAEGQALMSCDNFRATRYELREALPGAVILNIPRQAAKDLSAYNPKEVAWNDEMNWIHFRNDENTVFSCRIMAGEYPDVAGLFENVEGKKISLPKELKASLGRAEILAGEDEKSRAKVVHIEIADGQIICSGQGRSGRSVEKIVTTYKGEVPKFAVNPLLLAQILDVAQEAILTGRSLLFRGERFAHVVALISEEKEKLE